MGFELNLFWTLLMFMLVVFFLTIAAYIYWLIVTTNKPSGKEVTTNAAFGVSSPADPGVPDDYSEDGNNGPPSQLKRGKSVKGQISLRLPSTDEAEVVDAQMIDDPPLERWSETVPLSDDVSPESGAIQPLDAIEGPDEGTAADADSSENQEQGQSISMPMTHRSTNDGDGNTENDVTARDTFVSGRPPRRDSSFAKVRFPQAARAAVEDVSLTPTKPRTSRMAAIEEPRRNGDTVKSEAQLRGILRSPRSVSDEVHSSEDDIARSHTYHPVHRQKRITNNKQRRKSKSRPRSVRSPQAATERWGSPPPPRSPGTSRTPDHEFGRGYLDPSPVHLSPRQGHGRPQPQGYGYDGGYGVPQSVYGQSYGYGYAPPASPPLRRYGPQSHVHPRQPAPVRKASKNRRKGKGKRPIVAEYGVSPFQPLGIATADPALKRELRQSFRDIRPLYSSPSPPSVVTNHSDEDPQYFQY